MDMNQRNAIDTEMASTPNGLGTQSANSLMRLDSIDIILDRIESLILGATPASPCDGVARTVEDMGLMGASMAIGDRLNAIAERLEIMRDRLQF